jgi:hypothetical protein
MTMSVRARNGDAVFHRGTATWVALAEICRAVAPEICAACKHWYTNDGDGLDASRTIRLADVLEAKLLDGTVEKLISDRVAYASSLPDESCRNCGGSGARTDSVGVKFGFDKRLIEEPNHPRYGQRGWSNGCDGRGYHRPYKSYYPLKDKSDVEELVAFLRISGGFRIW